jgi:hypothetical protein
MDISSRDTVSRAARISKESDLVILQVRKLILRKGQMIRLIFTVPIVSKRYYGRHFSELYSTRQEFVSYYYRFGPDFHDVLTFGIRNMFWRDLLNTLDERNDLMLSFLNKSLRDA